MVRENHEMNAILRVLLILVGFVIFLISLPLTATGISTADGTIVALGLFLMLVGIAMVVWNIVFLAAER
jgi:hypothetical protein